MENSRTHGTCQHCFERHPLENSSNDLFAERLVKYHNWPVISRAVCRGAKKPCIEDLGPV